MSETGPNPWLDQGAEGGPTLEVVRPRPVRPTGPTAPHPGLGNQLAGHAATAPSAELAAPSPAQPRIWVIGVHGGAGESTIAELHPDFREAHHRWPAPAAPSPRCILVARTNAAGLYNARAAAKDWGAGTEPHILLLGLVLIPDAPGRIPKDLAREITRSSGGVPRVWQLPWIEDWRHHAPGYTQLDLTDLPRPVKKLLTDLDELTSLDATKEHHPR